MWGLSDIINVMTDNRTNNFRPMAPNVPLDRTDIAILGFLQNNARLSVKEIAADIGLAASSTHERIKRMRDAGVLIGTHVEVDPKALGIGLEALFMIELSKHERGMVDTFMDDVVEVPEVRFAFLVTGRYDLVVHVVVRDTKHLKDLALDQFTNRPGVTRIETSIIFDARRRYELPVLREGYREAGDRHAAEASQ
jgi:DNA-binding Lrp family transcriptional regulator